MQPEVFTAQKSAAAAGSDYKTATPPATVRQIDDTTWLYYFDEMIVGTASVAASAWGGKGHVSTYP